MKKLLIGTILLAILVGCQDTKSTDLVANDLYGKYKLVQFDKAAVEPSVKPMTISFEQGAEGYLKVHAVLCNNFIGQVKLAQGRLTTNGLASTRMACPREQEAVMETALGNMFKEGVKAELTGVTLKLEGVGHQFVYEKE